MKIVIALLVTSLSLAACTSPTVKNINAGLSTESPVQATSITKTENSPELIISRTIISDKDGMTLVYIPAGEFEMGSNEYADEQPIHTVYMDAYWIDQTEVTNAQYHLCVEAGVCTKPNKISYDRSDYTNHPVVYVNWSEASNYCNWAGRRLPTEAEWEKAARGTDGRAYPWGDELPNPDLLNYHHTIDHTTAVKSYPQGVSPYGVYDMAGNVWEWVADWYNNDYYGQSPTANPGGPAGEHSFHVMRSGSWGNDFKFVRSAYRGGFGYEPFLRSNSIGFRCATSQSS